MTRDPSQNLLSLRKGRGRWFHRHPRLTLSALAIAGCAAVILFAELAARVFFPSWAPDRGERVQFWAYSETLGWQHIPNQRDRFAHPDFSVEVAINSHGMRDDEFSTEETRKRRALVLGDSFGWGFGVEHQERFSEILENAHPDWEFVNASVSGYGTDQEYLYLKEKGMSFQPDLVLLLFYKNDFTDNLTTNRYWYSKPAFSLKDEQLRLRNVPVPRASARQLLDRFLLGRTHLGNRFQSGFSWPTDDDEKKSRAKKEKEEKKNKKQKNRERDEITYHLLVAASRVAKQGGAKFVLVSVPMSADRRARLQKTAEVEEFAYLPLDAHFRSLETAATFPNDAHWNAYGHSVAAEAIDEFLRQLGLFDSTETRR